MRRRKAEWEEKKCGMRKERNGNRQTEIENGSLWRIDTVAKEYEQVNRF